MKKGFSLCRLCTVGAIVSALSLGVSFANESLNTINNTTGGGEYKQ